MELVNPSGQTFRLLQSLARVDVIRNFRLKDLMTGLGMDAKQPAVFYRTLVKEAHDIIALLAGLRSRLAECEKEKTQALNRVSQLEHEVKELRSKVSGLAGDKADFQQMILGMSGPFKSYQALKEILTGGCSFEALDGLSDLIYGAFVTKATPVIRGRPQPSIDPVRLESLRERLRKELRELLVIPESELEKELTRVKAENQALKSILEARLKR